MIDEKNFAKTGHGMITLYCDECEENETLDELVHAIKLLKETKRRFELERELYNEQTSEGRYKADAMMIATTLQGLLEKTEK